MINLLDYCDSFDEASMLQPYWLLFMVTKVPYSKGNFEHSAILYKESRRD